MKIRDMELLTRVAESGSMSRAAKQLHLTPAAVSATVARLEEELGLRVFERTTRTLHPTEEGLAIINGCQTILAQWRQTLEDAQGDRAVLSGTVRLSAPVDTTYQLIEPIMASLSTAHPQLQMVVHASDTVHHLLRDAIDIAIRYGALADSTLTARKLIEGPTILVASPGYLEAHGAPETLAELSTHRCLTLQLANRPHVSWRLTEHGRAHTIQLDSPLCGDGYLSRRWAVAGMGVALKSLFDVIDDLESGQLVQVLPHCVGPKTIVHAVFPSHRFMSARVRAVDEAIAEGFAARADRCAQWLDAHDEG
ncbi:MAG: LysR family transcriptional regulator [Bradymonadia bacterium]